MAGIWERRRGEDGAEALPCALITVPANELLAEVHNEKLRMSTVLSEEGNEVWVAGNARKAMQVLRPNSSQAMEARQVGRRLYAN